MNTLSIAVDILAAASAVVFGLSAIAYRRLWRRAEAKLSLATALSWKHERLLEIALHPVELCVQLARKAGCDEEEVKCRSIANTMRHAIGMARKLESING